MIKSTVVSQPGVYIEELFSLSLSVATGATAVPAFAAPDAIFGDDASTPVLRIASFPEFSDQYACLADQHQASAKEFFLSVKSYFENGGGDCYLVRASSGMVDALSQLEDVTLFVQAGQDLRHVNGLNTIFSPGSGLFAILDGPKESLDEDPVYPAFTGSQHAATYYPWLTEPTENHLIPPSPAVAGLYCCTERTRGVWKAPAGTSCSLKGGYQVAERVSNETQGLYTAGNAINMIRDFHGTNVVWGARTQDDSDNWRYIPVRRLFDAVQRDIKKAMEPAVFEPNNHKTWESVRSAVDSYLYKLWKAGGLSGTTPGEAYFVNIGQGITMTDEDIEQGKMIVKIGMAAVRPAEFIILQFTQEVGQSPT